ncbi:MAG: isoleucine--tRNA ligase [Spirochaetaceae bacterium]|nr:isoleucine--tRNA ligase [Spirochaetaceae bacterium]
MYSTVNPKVDFPAQEEEILSFWQKEDIFQKSLKAREGAPRYSFYDGPPFATGLPHFGHFLPSTIKDIIPRYQTMRGKYVERRFGWDCHGLPVENLIEKELGLNSKHEIEACGIEKFNEACRDSVLRYVAEWRETITRLGRWVDFDNDYKTMNPDYMESIWWIVKSLWEKGLLYEGHYILPYCPRCATVLSNHELNLGGYKDVHDPAITIRFKLKNEENTYFLAWTTTPWTLPSNLGLTCGPEIEYVKVQDGDEFYILAESRLSTYYKSEDEYKVIWKKQGRDLLGTEYEPLFPYFANLAEKGAFRIFNADFVSTEDGTGIVHTAPGFGEDDNKVFKGTDVPTICPVDDECRFTEEVADFKGIFVKDADKAIMEKLKAEGKLVKREQILHSYPHCWRCSSPLIYRAVGSWFVKVEQIRDKLLKANSQIKWQPEHIKAGRFGKWLEGARDWAISRDRYWGNPIPVWKCESCGKTECIGSRDELKEKSGVYPDDLHKHFVDKITWKCECGGEMKRISEVLDCWFESGAMPYAQHHYPFENKEEFEKNFPADFISEGLDQTRGWFYTLTILAAAIFDKPSFRNCIVSGLVLASDGKKMSKSLRNYTDPVIAVRQFGADALRLFLMHSPAVKADDLKYSDEAVREVVKEILIPLWSSYGFFVTYANIDGVTCTGHLFDKNLPKNPLDRWILSMTQSLIKDVADSLDNYDLSQAIDPIVKFIDQMNNWYIRRSRRRFWKSENDSDKAEAYETLYLALKNFVKVAAPVIPFVTEAIWLNLRTEDEPQSVHLCDYPQFDARFADKDLEASTALVQKACSMGRSLRYQFNLKIRQPLASLEIVTRDEGERRVLTEMAEHIKEELNVKAIHFHDNETELVTYSAKANFRSLGKKLGAKMKEAAAEIEKLSPADLALFVEKGSCEIILNGEKIALSADDVIIQRNEKENLRVLNEGSLTVALDTQITDELRDEGWVRDLVRGIQSLRKESNFQVTDRIHLSVAGNAQLKKAFETGKDFIMSETLAVDATWCDNALPTTIDAGDEETWSVKIEKA